MPRRATMVSMRLRTGTCVALLGAAAAITAACSSSSDSAPARGAPDAAAPGPGEGGVSTTPPARKDAGAADAGSCLADAKPGELYALSSTSLATEDVVPMCTFKGKVLLIVNTASFCTYTPQYEGLQAIYDTYKARGFEVLGFPSKTFAQESDTDEEVATFCSKTYAVKFPMFQIQDVNGPKESPIYAWLKSQRGFEGDIGWNFEKFLLSRKGQVVARWDSSVTPESATITQAIDAELAKLP